MPSRLTEQKDAKYVAQQTLFYQNQNVAESTGEEEEFDNTELCRHWITT